MKLPRQDNYEVAFQLAKETFLGAKLEERCAKSGAVYLPAEGLVEVPFVNRRCCLHLPEVRFTWAEGGEVPLLEQILILHYLNTASGVSPTGKWITFAQVPGGEFYRPVFRQRTLDRLVRAFGDRPEKLVPAAQSLGGREVEPGEVGVTIPVLPRVAVTFVLWRGDEEIPPAGNVLFDETISEYLPPEDIVVVTGLLVSRLCRWVREEGKGT